MKILGIHDGHCATACYLKDGKLVALVSEERFTNKKNQGGYPVKSIQWILESNSLLLKDFDYIALGSYAMWDWSQKDETVYNAPLRKILLTLCMLFPKKLVGSHYLIKPFVYIMFLKRKIMIKNYCKKYGLIKEKIKLVEHHTAHAYSALYGSGFTNLKKEVLVFTCDAAGDGLSNTVSTWFEEKGFLRIQQRSAFHSLGMLYSEVTKYLGMKANEHEYKIMGMAPYVQEEYSNKAFQKFLTYIDFNFVTGQLINKRAIGPKIGQLFKNDFYCERFDNICSGVQRHFEYIITNWIKYWSLKTNIKSVVLAGGSFMNVKGNMLISEIGNIDNFFFCPSSGDESIAFGAAFKIAEDYAEKTIDPIHSLFLGPSFNDTEIETTLNEYNNLLSIEKHSDIEKIIAQLIADNNIVARFKNKAEWGARALGNRSILCRGDDLKVIHKLNKSIKMRDFWMPFASSLLDEDEHKYLENPKKLLSPYMITTFRTKYPANQEIIAGLHPFDMTCRPQIVTANDNPDYHKLLKHFKELTGIGGILNTSFNLHGFPIVGSPKSAIETLINSNLEYLAIGNYLVKKLEK